MLTRAVARAAASLAIAALIVGMLMSGTAQADPIDTVLDYRSTGWTYQQVESGDSAGFEAPSFDDSAWATGQGGFGTFTSNCGFENSYDIHTYWDGEGDELIRHHFTVPAGTKTLHINGNIDNFGVVYLNGTEVGRVEDGYCRYGGIDLDVPASLLTADNVVAIRATNYSGPAIVDAQLIATDEVTAAPKATVTSVSPASGPTAGGNTVTITGTGFLHADRVQFGTRFVSSAGYTIVSDTVIRAVAPGGAKGVVQVRVHTVDSNGKSAGLSAKSKKTQYTYTS